MVPGPIRPSEVSSRLRRYRNVSTPEEPGWKRDIPPLFILNERNSIRSSPQSWMGGTFAGEHGAVYREVPPPIGRLWSNRATSLKFGLQHCEQKSKLPFMPSAGVWYDSCQYPLVPCSSAS